MPQTVVVPRGTPAIRAMLIAVLVTFLVLGAIALGVSVWSESDEGTLAGAGFGPYTPGDPPVMGDIHFTPATAVSSGFGVYDPGAPPIMRDPSAGALS